MVDLVFQVLKIFTQHGLFDEGVELIGSWCFHLYQKHLGVQPFPLRTQDIDFLVPNPYLGKEHKDFVDSLKQLGFQTDFYGDDSLYLWNAELKIEFITPEKGRGSERAIKIKKLGIAAVPLRFVHLLLADPIIVVEQGMKIRVPRPVHFCFHKLIIASRRRNADKRLKDLQQAVSCSAIVAPEELQTVFFSLPSKWRSAVLKMGEKAREELPLMTEVTERLLFALQGPQNL